MDRDYSTGRKAALPPGVGAWLPDGFWFSTGSLAARNLLRNGEIAAHLEDGQEVAIVEGIGQVKTDQQSLPTRWSFNQ